jgi:cell wall-associated NlpC family hydrolase
MLVTGFSAALTLALAPSAPAYAGVDDQIRAATQRLESATEQYDAVGEDLAATQAQLAAIESRLVPLRQELDRERDAFGAISRGAYEWSSAGIMSTLLAAGSPQAFVDRVSLLDGVARVRNRQAVAIIDLSNTLDAQQGSLVTALAQQRAQLGALMALRASIQQQLTTLNRLRSQQIRPAPTALRVPAGSVRPPTAAEVAADPRLRAVAFAFAQLGRSYQYGASGPDSYDCSGLTMAAWRAAAVSLPHNAERQWESMPHITRAALLPGDLVFYYNPIHHVSLYVGDGQVIHAPGPGEPVTVAPIDTDPIHGYGRPA